MTTSAIRSGSATSIAEVSLFMTKSIRVITKKMRGRPLTTGKGTLIGVRMQPDELAVLDSWLTRDGRGLTRPQAIRLLVELGLGAAKPIAQTSANTSTKAKELAGQAIDGLADPRASTEERAERKRRLLKGPEEFLDLRRDHKNK
jgi:hypothetical protein